MIGRQNRKAVTVQTNDFCYLPNSFSGRGSYRNGVFPSASHGCILRVHDQVRTSSQRIAMGSRPRTEFIRTKSHTIRTQKLSFLSSVSFVSFVESASC